jgi:hypothetical protein
LDIPYGVREGEKFDIFGAELLPNGIPVVITDLKGTFFFFKYSLFL